MLYLNPNETYFSKLFQKEVHLEKQLQNYIVQNSYHLRDYSIIKPITSDTESIEPVLLFGLGDLEEQVPPFVHVYFSDSNKWAAMDFRPFVTIDKMSKKIKIRNLYDFELTQARFILSSLWKLNATGKIYTLKLAHEIYGSWLGDTISKKFGLEPQDQVRIQALALIFYASLFENNFNEESIDKLIIRFRKETFITDDLLKETYRRISTLNNINDFCENCFNVTGNMRLKGFNFTVLMNIIQTNWLSVNGKDILFTALEHPPTWVSIIYGALNIRSFSKSYIANIADRVSKRGKGDEFNTQYASLTTPYYNDEIIKNIFI